MSDKRAAVKYGWCEPEVVGELPHLRLLAVEVDVPDGGALLGPASNPVRERLASLSNRFNGAKAISIRREPVPAAHRVFFRQIGLDPDVVRTPIEEAIFMRMLDGAFLSTGMLADMLLVALVDTGVAVWALDADVVEGELGLRTSRPGEPLGRAESPVDRPADVGQVALDGGRLIVADATRALAVLYEQPASDVRPSRHTQRLALYALQVDGVSPLAVEEALWIVELMLNAQL
ncbi:MAG TPA: hypothetical protein VGF95_13880 [Solirubrobacteraceae bacterium]